MCSLCFVRYIESDRQEAEELRNTLSRPQLRRAFLEVSIPQTRAALGHGPAQRTVILASGFSAARLCRANKEGEDGSCPFCHGPQGYWHHMMWDCPENPAGVATPVNALTRRPGWITKDPERVVLHLHICLPRSCDYGPSGMATLQVGACKAQVCGSLMLRHLTFVRSFQFSSSFLWAGLFVLLRGRGGWGG